MLVELGRPPLSIASQLYQPARPLPICAIHGHTCSGGALMVMAWVDVKMGSEIIASTGSERRLSRTVGTHVANAMTAHLLTGNRPEAVVSDDRSLSALNL